MPNRCALIDCALPTSWLFVLARNNVFFLFPCVCFFLCSLFLWVQINQSINQSINQRLPVFLFRRTEWLLRVRKRPTTVNASLIDDRLPSHKELRTPCPKSIHFFLFSVHEFGRLDIYCRANARPARFSPSLLLVRSAKSVVFLFQGTKNELPHHHDVASLLLMYGHQRRDGLAGEEEPSIVAHHDHVHQGSGQG